MSLRDERAGDLADAAPLSFVSEPRPIDFSPRVTKMLA